jgi:hypothetical protein
MAKELIAWPEGMEYDGGQVMMSLIPSITWQGRSRAVACFIVYSTISAKNKAQTETARAQIAGVRNVFPILSFCLVPRRNMASRKGMIRRYPWWESAGIKISKREFAVP